MRGREFETIVLRVVVVRALFVSVAVVVVVVTSYEPDMRHSPLRCPRKRLRHRQPTRSF